MKHAARSEWPELGAVLSAFRRDHVLTVPELVSGVRRYAGCGLVTPTMVYRWEQGKVKPRRKHTLAVARALGFLLRRYGNDVGEMVRRSR